MKNFLKSIILFILITNSFELLCQWNPASDPRIPITLSLTAFGANPDDNFDDSWAILKASKYIENKWDINGIPLTSGLNINYSTHYIVLEIPFGTNGMYIVGKQIPLHNGNIDGIDYGLECSDGITSPPIGNPNYLLPLIKYSAIFPGLVPALNTEGIVPKAVPINLCGSGTRWVTRYAECVTLFDINNLGVSDLQKKVDGVYIKGLPSVSGQFPRFKYIDGLVTGMADENMDHVDNQGNGAIWGYYTNTPYLFSFYEVDHINIENIEGDGNNQHNYFIGQNIADNFQNGSIGLYAANSKHLTVKNINFHHFGLDGILLKDLKITSPTYFYGENIICEYNQRQAFSILGGQNVTIIGIGQKCKFNYTGKAQSLVQSGYVVGSTPGAGLDLEPDHNFADNQVGYCKSIQFTNCEFIDNGIGITNDLTGASPATLSLSNDIKFIKCSIWNGSGYGIRCEGEKVLFDDCDIWCGIVGGYGSVAYDFANRTIYNDCRFEDIANPYLPSQNISQSIKWFFEIGNSNRSLELKNCNFKVHRENCDFIHMEDYSIPKAQFNLINNCTFIYDNTVPIIGNITSSTILNTRFQGNNLIDGTLVNTGSNRHEVDLKRVFIEGSDNPCLPTILEVKGRVVLGVVPSSQDFDIGKKMDLTDGYAKLIGGNQSLLKMVPVNGTSNLMVNVNNYSSLIVENSGSIFCGGIYDIEGLFSVDENAYVGLTILPLFIGNGKIFLSNLCNPGGNNIHPFWNQVGYSGFGPWINNIDPNLTVYGQSPNSNLPSGVVVTHASPDYENISTNGSFTVFYSVGNSTCFGAANGFLKILIVGGSGSYSYSLNGGNFVSAPNIITGLGIGSHTIVIKDINNCLNSFTFEIAQPTALTFNSVTTTNVSCNGGNNGSISATATGGTGAISITVAPGGSLTNLTANTYTLTATDANGCTATTSVTISQPSALVFSSVTSTNVSCNGGINGSISATATGGTGAISITVAPGGSLTNLTANTYTLTATDANGCTATTLVTISQPSALVFSSVTSTNVSCNGGNNGSISATATGGTGAISITVAPGGSLTNLTANTYTLTATDANSCTVTTTVTITQPSTAIHWTYSGFNNQPCNSTSGGSLNVTAQGGTGTITYTLNPGNISNNSGNFTSIAPNDYTVTATDANNCSISFMFHAGAANSEHCCSSTTNPNAGSNLVNTLNMIIYDNPTALQIKAVYGNPINNRTFYISGIFDVNDDITFNGCTFYFTPNASVVLASSAIQLNLNNCDLQASCDWWGGVFANNSANKISGTMSSFEDMTTGIQVSSNALLSLNDCQFLNNPSQSLQILDMPDPNYAGVIKHCTFTGPAWTAIQVVNCKHLVIGDNSITSPSFNTISNMTTGITIESTGSISSILGSSSNDIEIHNCAISNIHGGDAVNGWWNPPGLLNTLPSQVYTTAAGAAIFINYELSPAFNANTKVQNSSADFTLTPLITNCDKGVVNIHGNIEARNLYLQNSEYGLMNAAMIEKNYTLVHNKIDNTHLGIQTIGIIGDADISSNSITGCHGMITLGNCAIGNTQAPIGIDIKHYIAPNPGANAQNIQANFISIDHMTGVGINTQTANENQNIIGNTIKFNTLSQASSIEQQTRDLVGLNIHNCQNLVVKENFVDGLNPSVNLNLFTARQMKGLYFQGSTGTELSCNLIRYVKQGLYAWGDNTVDATKMKYNKIKTSLNPLYTYDGTTDGTFGDIGTMGIEGANNWDYDLTVTILQNGKKILRNSTSSNPADKIYTTTNFLLPSQSASTGGNPYNVVNTSNNFLDPCIPPSGTFMLPPVLTGNGGGTVFDLQGALEIALENLEYNYYPDVTQWIDERRLFDKLEQDEILRNSNPTLLGFYNLKSQQLMGELEEGDLQIQALVSELNATNTGDLFDFIELQHASILNGESWELNDRDMNLLTLDIMRYGINHLNSSQREQIQTLANTCPYVGGLAVYKARSLQSIFNPSALYNDRVLCIPPSLSKGIENNNNNLDIDSLNDVIVMQQLGLNSMQPVIKNISNPLNNSQIVAKGDEIKIYPNPATDKVTITRTTTAKANFVLYNAIGEVVIKKDILKDENNIEFQLPVNIANGVYHYQIQYENHEKYMGKLTIKR